MTFCLRPRRAGVPFQWKGCQGCWAGPTRGPGLRTWPVGYRSPHGSARGSGLCTSCVLCLMRYMSVCCGVIVRIRINQRCVCVTSVVLVRFAPSDPGLRVVTLAWRSASCAGFSDGVTVFLHSPFVAATQYTTQPKWPLFFVSKRTIAAHDLR